MSPTAPRRIAIWGSAATRDVFDTRLNPDFGRWYQVVATAPEGSGFDEAPRQAFLHELTQAGPDYLIVDFSGDSEAIDQVAAHLRTHLPGTRVIVHRGPWASPDDQAIASHGWDVIDLSAEGSDQTSDYHGRFLAELHRRDLEARTDEETAERIRVIAEAGTERLRTQASFVTRADQAQRRAIREIETRGVLGTVGDVVRHRRPRATGTSR